MTIENSTKNLRSQCGVVVYPWRSEALVSRGRSTGIVSDAGSLDISSRIINLNYSKSIGSPSGVFSFALANNTGLEQSDWREIIRVGQWVVIYLSQDGDLPLTNEVRPPRKRYPKQKIRCIGYIERVAVQTSTDDTGAFTAMYEVSGRDFGIIYEETTIWHDLFMFEATALQAASGNLSVVESTSLDQQLRTVHDLFYAPQRLLPKDTDSEQSLTSISKQWLMPRKMLRDIGLRVRGDSYWGNIDRTLNFEKSAMNVPVNNPIDFLSGNAWGKLKQLSVASYHELFTEVDDDGTPRLNFRPIPWRVSDRRYPTIKDFITRFSDLNRIVVPAVDITTIDLGFDAGNRKNHFLTTIKTALFNVVDNISTLQGSRFPNENKDSVRRHGFRPMHVDINSLTLNDALGDGTPDKNLLIEFSEVMYDYWNNAIFLESGGLAKIGTNDVKLGRTLLLDQDVPYAANKLYYIENYADTFIVDGNGTGTWSQELGLTRGADLVDYQRGGRGLSRRNTSYDAEGEYTGF